MTVAITSAVHQGVQYSVQDALVLMQQAVRKGELQQAAAIGASAAVSLSIKLDDLSLLGEIASGAEATVLYGCLMNTDVAAKRFKLHHSDDLKRFRREVSILATLAPHPNIVPLLGARALPPDYLLIMPLAATTLHSKLYQLGWRPNTLELLYLALQAAEGLAAVHAKGIVHRDIKPSNMLVGFEGQLWLSDFGLAASVDEVIQESTLSVNMVRSRGKPTGGFLKRAMQGTLEYMAPEQLLKTPASHASDVYALAITINELAAGVYPFSDCTKDNPEIHTVLEHGYGRQELATAVAAEGLRPTLAKSAPEGLKQLLLAAWQLNPADRPTAVQMRDSLAALLHHHHQQQQGLSTCEAALAGASAAEPAMEVDQNVASLSVGSVQGWSLCSSRVGFSIPVTSGCNTPGFSAAGDAKSSDDESDMLTSSDDMLPLKSISSSNSGRISKSAVGSGLNGRSGLLAPGRPPRQSHGSVSTISTDVTGFYTTGDVSAANGARLDGGNATAAAVAVAGVPQPGVLGLIAQQSTWQQQQDARVITAGAFGALGPRESMEDRQVVIQGFGGDEKVTLTAVFDGHRGHEAAAYAAAQLPTNLLLASVQAAAAAAAADQQLAAASGSPAADDSSAAAVALKQAFLSTDAAFWQEWQAEMHAHAVVGQYNERYPGSTALAAVVAGNSLYVANAGDGRAVLSRGGTAVPLSRQHTADLADERSRVVAAGGTVMYRGGSWRVGPAALQVTRALGDFDLKQPGHQQRQQQDSQAVQPVLPGQLSGPVCLMGLRSPYHSVPAEQRSSNTDSNTDSNTGSNSTRLSPSSTITSPLNPSSTPPKIAPTALMMPVTAEPEVVSLVVNSNDQFLILGTDGLWDVITDQQAVGLVHDTVKDPALCAKRLVQEALARGSSDNVTAVVVFLQPKHTLERVWVRGGDQAVPDVTPTFYGSRRMTTKQLEEEAGCGVAVAAAPAGVVDEMMDTY